MLTYERTQGYNNIRQLLVDNDKILYRNKYKEREKCLKLCN